MTAFLKLTTKSPPTFRVVLNEAAVLPATSAQKRKAPVSEVHDSVQSSEQGGPSNESDRKRRREDGPSVPAIPMESPSQHRRKTASEGPLSLPSGIPLKRNPLQVPFGFASSSHHTFPGLDNAEEAYDKKMIAILDAALARAQYVRASGTGDESGSDGENRTKMKATTASSSSSDESSSDDEESSSSSESDSSSSESSESDSSDEESSEDSDSEDESPDQTATTTPTPAQKTKSIQQSQKSTAPDAAKRSVDIDVPISLSKNKRKQTMELLAKPRLHLHFGDDEAIPSHPTNDEMEMGEISNSTPSQPKNYTPNGKAKHKGKDPLAAAGTRSDTGGNDADVEDGEVESDLPPPKAIFTE
ncbi:hypothetical protein HK097_005053, partial [Rhizophlyctis rosea]